MSQPRELYSFVSNSTVYSVTSADTDQTYLDVVYKSITIGRDAINLDSELDKANINVTFDMDNVFANGWLTSQASDLLNLTVFSIDADDSSVSVIWKGRLMSTKPDLSAITLAFESIFTSLRNSGLRAKYQITCRFALYGRGCNIAASSFQLAGTLSAMAGNTLTVAEAATQPNGRFTGGMITGPDGRAFYIMSHVGTQITVIRANVALTTLFAAAVGGTLPVILNFGCDRSKETCLDVFNNVVNHGGFPYIPTVNPFGGTSIA